QALLNKVKNYWVKGVLETSLHDQVAIVLGLELRPEAIVSPWNLAIADAIHANHDLPPHTPIISVFDQMGVGRTLLILGEPGSGKTTTLLQLTRDLLRRTEQDPGHLIPVVLNLSSWAGHQASGKQTPGISFARWIVAELNSKYQIPKKIGQPWVEQQQLLLLLDGLDEVPEDYRDVCVAAINEFQRDYGTEMVVCSRIKDYEALSQRLHVQTAVYLQALTTEQIYHYLDQFRLDLTGLKTLLQRDHPLRELAQSPLLLNMMLLTYQDMAIEEVMQPTLIEERRQQLFDAYIHRMFQRRSFRSSQAPYSQGETIAWLSWLAQQLVNRSQTVFLIEQLQPTWLHGTRQNRIYLMGVLIVGILLAMPVAFASGMLTNGWIEGWSAGLFKSAVNCVIFGIVVGLMFRL
ncbi:MAG TPA: NACHT domain-containing protein, partial [Allocoleopsis sp.]